MMNRDDATLSFYAVEAEIYAARRRIDGNAKLARFLAALPPGGRVLELGCGGGQDSEAMLAQGFALSPTDGSPELARQAELRLGRAVRVLLFEDLDEHGAYDGVWANACLLHVPRDGLPGIVGKVHAALKPGGLFYASFKAGTEAGRDQFGRYYNYPSEDWLRQVYGFASWRSLEIRAEAGSGYDRVPTDWLHVMAFKEL